VLIGGEGLSVNIEETAWLTRRPGPQANAAAYRYRLTGQATQSVKRRYLFDNVDSGVKLASA